MISFAFDFGVTATGYFCRLAFGTGVGNSLVAISLKFLRAARIYALESIS